MNYRHGFHAGNFADVIKHAALTLMLDRVTAQREPLLVLDSHAGAGLYDLQGELACKSGEAQVGILRLMTDEGAPSVFGALKAAVRAANPNGGLGVYPGSPVLIANRLRRGDAYLGAELRRDDFDVLNRSLAASRGHARCVMTDGFDLVARHASDPRNLFAVIDPPFERPDDYQRIIEAIKPTLDRSRPPSVLVWLPLKDLETFDSFLRRLEGLQPPAALVVETRLYPLTDPMRMNGCALVLLGDFAGLEPDLKAASDWVVGSAGGAGGMAKTWWLTR